MLKKTKLRALSPGQWARVRVPDYEMLAEAVRVERPSRRQGGRHLRDPLLRAAVRQ